MTGCPSDFNPRSPCGERRKNETTSRPPSDFNPRSPCGERQQRCTNTVSVCCATRHILQKICSSLIILLHLQESKHAKTGVWRCEPQGKILSTWPSHLLNHEDPFRFIARLAAKMFYLVLVSIAQIIKPKTVTFRVHNRTELRLQETALRRIQQTFKDRVLHPLAIVHALLCDLTQSSPAGRILGVDIIGNQNQHTITSIKRLDIRPGPPADSAPIRATEDRGPAPMAFSRQDRGGLGSPFSFPASA